MPALSRRAPKLLRSVNNKPHASSKDHEDDAPQTARATQVSTQEMSEADILADPISSSDEAAHPPPLPSTKQSSNASSHDDTGSTARARNGASRTSQKGKTMRVPKRGAFKKGYVHKDSFNEEEKENTDEGSVSSSGKRRAEEGETVRFGMGDTPKKKQKTKNVHVASYTRKTFGRASRVPSLPKTKKGDYSHVEHLDDALSNIIDEYEPNAEPTDEEPPSSAANPPRDIPRLPPGYATSSNPMNDASQTTASSSPLSSVLDDSDEELRALQQEIAGGNEDSICALCQEDVDAEEQKSFWAEHSHRTVRDQMLFCKEHKRSRAQKEYTEQGFPEIDWTELPCRIRGFRSQLINLLRNETEEESLYRTRHAERLVSGKAAALPSKRRGKKVQDVEQEMVDKMDAASSSTGYYGPRGKRVMMEVITSDLSDVIREVAAKDPVVGRSGFAMFVQAVLVPELTIMLVMQDKECSKGMAQQIVGESGELGTLLHEEIDDDVRLGSDEEEEESEY